MLTADERHKLTIDWNATRFESAQDRHVEHLFEAQVARRPDALALRHDGNSVTYRELNVRANRLAAHLRELGLGPDQLVGVCTDRSPDMVVALLATLKVGAAYVPLDPSYPIERLAFMAEDAGLSTLVTQTRWQDRFQGFDVPTVLLDTQGERLAQYGDRNIPSAAGPDNLAYVIYTSGSTGKPKGVAVCRRGVSNFLNAMRRRLQFTSSDTILAITTISFDIAGLELYLPLVTGGRVVLVEREDAIDPARLSRLLEDENVSFMQATPATWRMLLDSPWTGKPDLRILCGGEAMTRDLADRLLPKGSCLWNLYGPTETTIWSTLCALDKGDEPISIGRPIDNTEIYILDDRLQLVPVGEVGELHIGGAGLARGYLNRPDLTREKFIPNPFIDDPDVRIYKTGDLARYWPDGRIECLGRVDQQVKIRGFRIELSEIEAHLTEHPAVKQAAVVARDDKNGEKYLAAYWVERSSQPDSSTGPTSSDGLREFLAVGLPRYMVPSVFVRLDIMPLTPNGKIDRRALPAPARQDATHEPVYVAPRTTVERQLVDIWEQLLEVEPIGVTDDFFALGGHSLAAARLVARIESALHVSIPVATLLTASTVESLARIIVGHDQPVSSVVVPFRTTGTKPPLFMVAGVGGHVLIFRELAELLGADQPVYGIQGIGLDGNEPPLKQMDAIADRYIREIAKIQPDGPIHLAGWSMGGAIAYEIARRLPSHGRTAGRLVIVDTYAPWAIPLRNRVAIHLDRFRRMSWRSKWTYLVQRLGHRLEVVARRVGLDHQAENLDGRMADLVRASSLAQFEALRQYRPEAYAGDVVLLRADQTADIRDPRSDAPDLGWATLVRGRISVLPIPGSHTQIFVGRNVCALAAAMESALGEDVAPACLPADLAGVAG